MKKESERPVLLINPPSRAPNPVLPLGLAYIAAYLRENGIAVRVLDAWAEGLEDSELGRRAGEINPFLTGVTVTSPQYGAAVRTIRAVRSNCPDTLIAVGGPHPSALPHQTLEDNLEIDYAVVGEGEETLLRLIQAISSKVELDGIKGLAYRENGRIKYTGFPAEALSLDSLPFPARDLFPLERYQIHPPYGKSKRAMTMITSRGCPYRCTYCADPIFGKKYRAMSPKKVVDEIAYLVEKYKVREIHHYDDDFTMNMKRTREICEEIKTRGIKINWSCTTRVDLVDESLLRAMKEAGCWLISYGVESADQRILDKARKGYSIQRVEESFRLTKKLGIRTVGYFMVGLPGETLETLQKTIDFSTRIKADFTSWGITSLYPGSPLYQLAEEGKLPNAKSIKYTVGQGGGPSTGSPYGDGFAIIYEEQISRKDLESYVRAAVRKFYLRLGYMLRFIFLIRSWYEFRYYLTAGVRTVLWIFSGKNK